MKVLLMQDVYKLGRAGDTKKVADGYGRNYLIPQGLAMLATPGAMKQADTIRTKATMQRALLNDELSGLAEMVSAIVLTFGAKAGETGKLYGAVTTQMIADALNKKLGAEKIDRRQIELEPIRSLGEYLAQIRLTIDLVPTVKVIVHREGEAPITPQSLEDAGEATTDKAPAGETEVVAEEVGGEVVAEAFDQLDDSEDALDEADLSADLSIDEFLEEDTEE